MQALRRARALLCDITPLRQDCGAFCGAACCRPDEEGRGGMLLFPGELQLYSPTPTWAELMPSDITIAGETLPLLTCQGTCPRAERPLACRIFPLTPVLRRGELAIISDRRAWPVCPLMPSGIHGLQPAFVEAVTQAMGLLMEDAACRAYFRLLTQWMREYRKL